MVTAIDKVRSVFLGCRPVANRPLPRRAAIQDPADMTPPTTFGLVRLSRSARIDPLIPMVSIAYTNSRPLRRWRVAPFVASSATAPRMIASPPATICIGKSMMIQTQRQSSRFDRLLDIGTLGEKFAFQSTSVRCDFAGIRNRPSAKWVKFYVSIKRDNVGRPQLG